MPAKIARLATRPLFWIPEVSVPSAARVRLVVRPKNANIHGRSAVIRESRFTALSPKRSSLVCVETRHMQALLKAQINKTDRNDARGMAQMMRVGLYRPVHVKTLRSQKLRMLLSHRKLLQSKAIAIENDLRGTLRNFGIKVGMAGTVKFETRIKELVGTRPSWLRWSNRCLSSGGCFASSSSSCIAACWRSCVTMRCASA